MVWCAGWHLKCLEPPLEKVPEQEVWLCSTCKGDADNQGHEAVREEPGRLETAVIKITGMWEQEGCKKISYKFYYKLDDILAHDPSFKAPTLYSGDMELFLINQEDQDDAQTVFGRCQIVRNKSLYNQANKNKSTGEHIYICRNIRGHEFAKHRMDAKQFVK